MVQELHGAQVVAFLNTVTPPTDRGNSDIYTNDTFSTAELVQLVRAYIPERLQDSKQFGQWCQRNNAWWVAAAISFVGNKRVRKRNLFVMKQSYHGRL